MASCMVCRKEIEDGQIGYELQKGTFTESEEGFVFEDIVGAYHDACLPADLPIQESEGDGGDAGSSDSDG